MKRDILRHVIARAVRLRNFGHPTAAVFTTDTFAVAMQERFSLDDTPGDVWCSRVLEDCGMAKKLTSDSSMWKAIEPLSSLEDDR